MMVGLAVDFSNLMLQRYQLTLAADAGVLAGVTQAATRLGPNPSTYLQKGQAAGLARFMGQGGIVNGVTANGQVSNISSNLTLQRQGPVISGSLTWTASYTPFFGRLFGITAWPLGNSSGSSIQISTPYLNVYVVLDNSPSMEIGASDKDIQTLQQLTACSSSGAFYYSNGGWTQLAPASGQIYGAYTCASGGTSYDGTLTCPIPATAPLTFSTFNTTGGFYGPSCQGMLPMYNGQYPMAGAPCAFACHFDTGHAAGAGSDYFAVARGTIGQSNQVTLRFDVVKAAVRNLIATMQSMSQQSNTLNIRISTLDQNLTQVYPSTGDVGNGWSAAAAAVGGPPTAAYGQDTGIQPYSGGNVADTDFTDNLTALASSLTPSGGGTSAQDAQKVLILVTDGVEDYCTGGNTGGSCSGTRVMRPLDPSLCQAFKDMDYTVFVLYTPYYPLMNGFYLQNMASWAEGSGPSSVSYNLQQCASAPSDYLVASNSADMTAALQTFLSIALTTAARLTQ